LILIKFCGLIGFSLASIHVLMSLVLISPSYYPKYFSEMGKLNLTGELSLVFGVLSMWCLAVTAITSLPFMYEAVGAERWQRGQRMGYLYGLRGLARSGGMAWGASAGLARCLHRGVGAFATRAILDYADRIIPRMTLERAPDRSSNAAGCVRCHRLAAWGGSD